MEVACLVPRPVRRAEAIRAALEPLASLSDRIRLTFFGHRAAGRSVTCATRSLESFGEAEASCDVVVYVLDGAWDDVRQVALWAASRPGVLVVPEAESPWLGAWSTTEPPRDLATQLLATDREADAAGWLAGALAHGSLATIVGDVRSQALLADCPRVRRIVPASARGAEAGTDTSLIASLRQRFELPSSVYLFAAFGMFGRTKSVAAMLAVVSELDRQGYPVRLLLGGPVEEWVASIAAENPGTIVTGYLDEAEYRGLWQMSDVVFRPRSNRGGAGEASFRIDAGAHIDQAVVELRYSGLEADSRVALASLLTELEHLMQSPATRRRGAATAAPWSIPNSYAAELWGSVLEQAAINGLRSDCAPQRAA